MLKTLLPIQLGDIVVPFSTRRDLIPDRPVFVGEGSDVTFWLRELWYYPIDLELWSDDQDSPIGSASFMIPPSHDPSAYFVKIKARYIYSSSEGSAVPVPQFARTTIQLMGVAK